MFWVKHLSLRNSIYLLPLNDSLKLSYVRLHKIIKIGHAIGSREQELLYENLGIFWKFGACFNQIKID